MGGIRYSQRRYRVATRSFPDMTVSQIGVSKDWALHVCMPPDHPVMHAHASVPPGVHGVYSQLTSGLR